jgi:hypothetical protein
MWVEGDLRLNSGAFVYLNNPSTTNKISTGDLYCLANVSSNIQAQLNLKLEQSNLTTYDTGIQTQINNLQPKFYIASRIFSNATISNNFGLFTLGAGNINNSSAGTYVFTITAHPSGSNYIIMATASPNTGASFVITTVVNSSTSFTVYIRDMTNVLTNTAFNIHTIP